MMTIGRLPVRIMPLTLAALLVTALAAAPRAQASTNLFNIYFGAGYGHADIKASAADAFSTAGITPGSLDAGHPAYQFMAGVRVLSVLGAEVDYFDLGSVSGSPNWSGPGTITGQASQKGEAAFALLYLPIPIIDVYAKAGVARLTTEFSGTYTVPGCVGTQCTCMIGGCGGLTEQGAFATTTTAAAVGAGIQWKLGNWAVRGEYERFTAFGEHPSFASIGMTWVFL